MGEPYGAGTLGWGSLVGPGVVVEGTESRGQNPGKDWHAVSAAMRKWVTEPPPSGLMHM